MAQLPPGVTLGQHQDYVDHYEPSLLQPIPRAPAREGLPQLACKGVDNWTAYELSWLDASGKPQVAVAEFVVPADSHNIIESKSFKYYLNSFNHTRLANPAELHVRLERDLGQAAGGKVEVRLMTLDQYAERKAGMRSLGQCLDGLPLAVEQYQPAPELLLLDNGTFAGVWYSHLLKTNCPVTGQPDWASIWIGYEGRAIAPQSLLAYIVSFRQHQDFHEQCVERIYGDLWQAINPRSLWVYARYTRRGGLDINPFRSSDDRAPPLVLAPRQ